ncbi:MAG: scavenger receptor cysteine-rich domain-containing protein [Halobacteriovoraceae bacterium]|nr:scavenger receptor cysteine-rich domain-containing protein [Halobacteriovoraceae bacterium]
METWKKTLVVVTAMALLGSIDAFADDRAVALKKANNLLQKLKSDIQGYPEKKVKRVLSTLSELETIMSSNGGGRPGGPGRPGRNQEGALSIDNGFLEVHLNGEWKGVCDDSFDRNDAEVACRQLGGTYVSYSTGVSGSSDDFWLDDLSCTGDEQFLSQCSHAGVGTENCGSGEHVQVTCEGLPPSRRSRNSIRNTTVLEVLHEGEWKPVCDDSFDRSDAEVACRQMGLELVRYSTGQNAGTDDFWLDDLGCNGQEATLSQCRHSGFGNENCGSSEGVQIICQ